MRAIRALSVLCLTLILLLGSCNKDDDPSFSSAEGSWTYSTPDGKISVDFDLKNNSSTWEVINESITVDGTKASMTGLDASNVAPPIIGSIRINANDADLVYDYFILFTDMEVSGDFKEIKVPHATYMWPHGELNDLTDITITRK